MSKEAEAMRQLAVALRDIADGLDMPEDVLAVRAAADIFDELPDLLDELLRLSGVVLQ
ncbi:MAG: hypothetical protein H6981_04585 [Gammaproteobacteria bacterium]|nr:hypothetical protein [Gammaproteobacteria bacterium]